jgi:hypothetical protein
LLVLEGQEKGMASNHPAIASRRVEARATVATREDLIVNVALLINNSDWKVKSSSGTANVDA